MFKRIIATLLLALILNACALSENGPYQSSNNSDEAQQGVPAICLAIPKDDLLFIMGSSYRSMPVDLISEGADGCKYVATEERNGMFKNINFIVRNTNSPEQAESEYYRAVNTWQNSRLENREYMDIEDVGSQAFFAYSEKTPQFITYQDNTLVILTFGNYHLGKDLILAYSKKITTYLLNWE